ncbi:hypothetical protein DB346_15505 [Verrucomicrobia bacterium LW23]|nr:hypothetical protein DB346_15505 [Verrucomicrobia bacterium LW23]
MIFRSDCRHAPAPKAYAHAAALVLATVLIAVAAPLTASAATAASAPPIVGEASVAPPAPKAPVPASPTNAATASRGTGTSAHSLNPQDLPPWAVTAFAVYGGLCLLSLLAMLRLAVLALLRDGPQAFNNAPPHFKLDDNFGWMLILAAACALTVSLSVPAAAALLLFAALARGNERLGLRRMSIGTAAMIGIWLFLAIIPILNLVVLAQLAVYQHLNLPTPDQAPVQAIRELPWDVVLLLFVPKVIFVAPVYEEIVFRGLLHPAIKQTLLTLGDRSGLREGPRRAALGAWGATLLTSLVFAAIHFNLMSFLPLFVLALVLSLTYEYTGSLNAAIALHITFNVVNSAQVLLMRFAREQGMLPASLLGL